MHRYAAALVLCACVIAIPCAEARPRDPVGVLFSGIGKAFMPMKVAKRHVSAPTQKRQKTAVHYHPLRSIKAASAPTQPHPTTVSPARFRHASKPKPVPPNVGALDRYDEVPRLIRGVPNASWYGEPFHGRKTASGVTYDMYAPMCAHRRMAFGTVIRVTNLDNGKHATCVIRDRGPYISGRILDVSKGIAAQLGMLKSGVARVSIGVIE
jgi:rare lipoprotein A (peptidoglycan hydrolase)